MAVPLVAVPPAGVQIVVLSAMVVPAVVVPAVAVVAIGAVPSTIAVASLEITRSFPASASGRCVCWIFRPPF